jgi:hypothetical protein
MRKNHRPVKVLKDCDKEWIEERKVCTIVNVEEDQYGRDVLTYICPSCGKPHKSLRVA